MKTIQDTSRERFNQLVLGALLLLFSGLCVIFIIGKSGRLENEFSLQEFENEVMLQAYFAAQNGNHQAEIQFYDKLLQRIPELEPELSFRKGKAEYMQGQYIDAITNFSTSLITGFQDSVEVFFNVALTDQKLKKYAMAEKYYLKVIDHPQYAKEACFNLANLYFFEYNNEEKALKFYQNAINNESAEKAYADMLFRELKINTLRKDSLLHHFLKNEINRNREIDFSRYDLQSFDKNKPEKVQAYIHNYIGIIQVNNNNKEAALSHFEQAMYIDPKFQDARFNFNKLISEIK